MQAYQIIKAHKNIIIERWVKELRAEFPLVNKYSKTAIQNDVPELIDSLIKSLDNEGHPKDFAGNKHGRQRTNFKEYSLLHVIREYRLLKQTIFKVIDEGYKIKPAERDKIMYAVDKATESAAETFFQVKSHDLVESNEKAKEDIKTLKNDDRTRNEFINALWHDINSPLNNVRLSSELMEGEDLPPRLSRLVDIIKSNTSKVAEMVKNLLDVNLVSFGQNFPLKKASCNLNEFLHEALHDFQLEHGQRMIFKADPDPIRAVVDCRALLRALDNLVTNAVKYGDNSKPVILECKRQGPHILISVTNYGNFIPPEKQDEIFVQFYRIRGSKVNGWGIGLHLVKIIAEAHGGNVTVVSKPVTGTIFTISLPVEPETDL